MKLTKHFIYVCSLPVGIALMIFLFLGYYYPHHLHYQEQLQLFLFDTDYALDILRMPGGLSDYLGRFMTQFFLYAWAGAALLSFLLAVVLYLMLRITGSGWLMPLSVLPVLLLVRWLCDDHALAGGIVALLMALLSAWGLTSISNKCIRQITVLFGLPILYWATGPIAIVSVIFASIDELKRDRSLTVWGYLCVMLSVALALPAFLSTWVAVEPHRMYCGIHYLRSEENGNQGLWLAALSVVAVAAISALWRSGTELLTNRSWMPFALSLVLSVIGGMTWVCPEINHKAETVMAYDFMTRMKQWNRIQQVSAAKAPHNAMCATSLNLAMAKSGRMSEHLFDYMQRGTQGLLPNFESDATSPLFAAEVFYHLGMINTAQRYTFEAQEAILDYQKSGRCYKRLAETNLILGNYAVSRKYLRCLQKTIFYRDWANETLELLSNEEAIERHPEYGELRKNKMDEDRFFSNNEYLQMLQGLFLSNKSNRLAFEYLLSACMLQRNLEMFDQCLEMNTELHYSTMPVLFQQAKILSWTRTHDFSESMPEGVSPEVFNGLKLFMRDCQQIRNVALLEQRYGKTFWYYYIKE